MDGQSLNLSQNLLSQLQAIAPAAFTEGRLDVDRLRTLLGEDTLAGPERYELNWPGRAEAYRVLQRPTTETLVPNPDDSIRWDETENVFIEGENLAVLKTLQKSYYGKVKMIYIDPPYNTGSDSFIYPDKFSETREEYARRVGDKDTEGYMLKEGLFRKNSKDNGHYHSNWLNMMLPRLHLARNLLTDDGVIFVSIDDHEQANLKLLMDQVFGEENYMAHFVWKSRLSEDTRAQNGISNDHEYILVYSKAANVSLQGTLKDQSKFSNPDDDPRGPWRSADMTGLASKDRRPNLHYNLINPNTSINYGCPPKGWRFGVETMAQKVAENRVLWPSEASGRPRQKLFLNEMDSIYKNTTSVWLKQSTSQGTKETNKILGTGVFDFPKPAQLLEKLINQGAKDRTGIILDFFSGSGTTAHAVLDLNEQDGGHRKFICVQLPEPTEEGSEAFKAGYTTISAIAEARIKKVIEKIEGEREPGPPDGETPQVLGFRKFTLSPSNFKEWRGDVSDVETLGKQMELHVVPEREDALTENILWELLLKQGRLLTEQLTEHGVGEGRLWTTADGKLAFALEVWDEAVTAKVLELRPEKVIALDSAFGDRDARKSNAQLQCEDAGVRLVTV